jgi:hypothetical protein
MGRIALLTSVCALVFGMALSLPVTVASDGLILKTALAGNGNGGGNGKGNGPDGAPGKLKQDDTASSGENDAIDGIEGDGAVAESDGGESVEEPTIIPIAEDEKAAEKKVLKEIAGLTEESELSEEEELEAIRNGWGTWRTADGPETVLSQ